MYKNNKNLFFFLFLYRIGFILDFILTVVPLQVFMSILGDYSSHCLLISLVLSLVTSYACINMGQLTKASMGMKISNIPMGNKRPFITYYRAYVNLFTAFSILAVDFKIFPRYFAKAETYGTGLMDVGVGCFLVSNAIVSPEAKGRISVDRCVIFDARKHIFRVSDHVQYKTGLYSLRKRLEA